ncbi:unnamed protein product [Polarella glacialis]|uniref:Uncharacterized protein n=1 Tax=Polarella glacialis TaxID=89957 RepID=A0A813EN18_POLGL|nr:unnamed protein product [Polarella glacialis]
MMWQGVKKNDRPLVMERELIAFIVFRGGSCTLVELELYSSAWKTGHTGLGKLGKYISSRQCFVLEGPKKNHVRLSSQSVGNSMASSPTESQTPLPGTASVQVPTTASTQVPTAAPTPPPTQMPSMPQQVASKNKNKTTNPVPKQTPEAASRVLEAFKETLGLKPGLVCCLDELSLTPAWTEFGHQLGKLRKFLERHHMFSFEMRKGAAVFVRLRVARDVALPTRPQTGSLAWSSSHGADLQHLATPTDSSSPPSATVPIAFQPRKERKPALTGTSPQASNCSTAEGLNGGAVCLAELHEAPPKGTRLVVRPSDVRWTHGCLQRLFTCGRSLASVAGQLQRREIPAAQLPTISLVLHEGKWYSRNNRRLWCFKASGLAAIEAVVSSVDNHFLRGLNTSTDGWSVDFFPPVLCAARATKSSLTELDSRLIFAPLFTTLRQWTGMTMLPKVLRKRLPNPAPLVMMVFGTPTPIGTACCEEGSTAREKMFGGGVPYGGRLLPATIRWCRSC